MDNDIDDKIRQVYSIILSKPLLRVHVDTKHGIPAVHRGSGKIKLIIIGQDPTVKNKASRKNITSVLGLNRPGKMQRYVFGICERLNVDPLNELYATNLFKNFFEEPPDHDSDVLHKFYQFWFPVLEEELSRYRNIPVITLGDKVIQFISKENPDNLVRNYWGYTEDWHLGGCNLLKHIPPDENLLGKPVFPFPRQPSIIKEFYASRLDRYIDYIRQNINHAHR
jgi:uracil-DNA glycosylase